MHLYVLLSAGMCCHLGLVLLPPLARPTSKSIQSCGKNAAVHYQCILRCVREPYDGIATFELNESECPAYPQPCREVYLPSQRGCAEGMKRRFLAMRRDSVCAGRDHFSSLKATSADSVVVHLLEVRAGCSLDRVILGRI